MRKPEKPDFAMGSTMLPRIENVLESIWRRVSPGRRLRPAVITMKLASAQSS